MEQPVPWVWNSHRDLLLRVGRVMEEPQIVPFWSPERKAYERMGCEWEKNQRMSEGGHGSVSYQTGSVPALSAGLGVGQGFGVQSQNESPQEMS